MKSFSFAQNWWQFVIVAIVCYFIGCFNFARLISRSKNRDITKIGSGNPGTMNMSREFGLKVGLLTFLCDALKGGAPAVIVYFLYRGYVFEGTVTLVSDFARYFSGLFVVSVGIEFFGERSTHAPATDNDNIHSHSLYYI